MTDDPAAAGATGGGIAATLWAPSTVCHATSMALRSRAVVAPHTP
jgi:hypothetical protein